MAVPDVHPLLRDDEPNPPSLVPGHSHTISDASTATVDIEAWTISALQSLSVSPIARGTGGTPLSIPLDDHHHHGPAGQQAHGVMEPVPGEPQMRLRAVTIDENAFGAGITPPRRPPSRRDSMVRREALLKGKEGSRQRRRWENDRLMHIPNVEPPQPVDWEPLPTHPVVNVPYHVAQLWDKGVRERAEQRKAALATHRKTQQRVPGVVVANAAAVAAARADVGKIPRELRDTAKKTPGPVRLWLRDLEEPVRQFLVEQGAVARPDTPEDEMDSGDEELVFVGRNGGMREGKKGWKKARREVANKPPEAGMVLESAGDEEGAAFKRWLTHSISDYYGILSRSVSVGTPARRAVYVTLKSFPHAPPMFSQLPPPLWEMF